MCRVDAEGVEDGGVQVGGAARAVGRLGADADGTVFLFWNRNVVRPRHGDVLGRRMWAVWCTHLHGVTPPVPKVEPR